MSIIARILRNTVTNIAGQTLNTIAQFLQISILTSVWGLSNYGIWVMLSTIPTYFALSDLGFATTATSSMTMSFARGDFVQTRITYQSTWLMLLLISTSLLILLLPIVFLQGTNLPDWLHWTSQYGTTIFLFASYSAGALCSRLVVAGLSSTGHYSTGTFGIEFLGFVEAMLVLLTAWLGAPFSGCIVAGLLWRIGSLILLDQILQRRVPSMALGFEHAQFSEIQRLFLPALAAMTIPLALSINIQGFVMVIGTFISPQSVTIFTTVRTTGRLVLQMVNTLNRGSMPEISKAVSRNDQIAIKHVLQTNIVAVLAVLLPGTIVFGAVGRTFIRWWTSGRISPEPSLVYIMALAIFLQGIWVFGSNLLVAINRHTDLSHYLLLISIISIMISAALVQYGGLITVSIVLMLTDASCIGLVYLMARTTFLQR